MVPLYRGIPKRARRGHIAGLRRGLNSAGAGACMPERADAERRGGT